MKHYSLLCAARLAFMSGILFAAMPAFPQVVNAGLKGGFNMSWTGSDDRDFRKEYNTSPVPGFNAGVVFAFQMKKRYFLHTEVLYATKGRIVTGELGLRDKAIHNYIEVPVLYQLHFKGNLSAKRMTTFKWYAGIGPNFSYWLGGKGTITHFEITDHDVPELPYKIRFGVRPPEHIGESDYVYVRDARRVQVGMNIGGGVLVEPADNRKIVVDFRFELGHSWLGGAESGDYVFPTMYSKSLEARNLGARLSVMYLLQTNLDKKVRNKGKSNVVKKGNMMQKKQ